MEEGSGETQVTQSRSQMKVSFVYSTTAESPSLGQWATQAISEQDPYRGERNLYCYQHGRHALTPTEAGFE